jgi:DNA-binding response OmpR family regulator
MYHEYSSIGESIGDRMKILVVEDETMVALLLEDMLDSMGHEVIGPAASVDEAMTLISENTFDVALLDINLGSSEKAFPVADHLDAMKIPYALVSGYDPGGIEGYDHAVNLQKPFSVSALMSTVAELRSRVLIG